MELDACDDLDSLLESELSRWSEGKAAGVEADRLLSSVGGGMHTAVQGDPPPAVAPPTVQRPGSQCMAQPLCIRESSDVDSDGFDWDVLCGYESPVPSPLSALQPSAFHPDGGGCHAEPQTGWVQPEAAHAHQPSDTAPSPVTPAPAARPQHSLPVGLDDGHPFIASPAGFPPLHGALGTMPPLRPQVGILPTAAEAAAAASVPQASLSPAPAISGAPNGAGKDRCAMGGAKSKPMERPTAAPGGAELQGGVSSATSSIAPAATPPCGGVDAGAGACYTSCAETRLAPPASAAAAAAAAAANMGPSPAAFPQTALVRAASVGTSASPTLVTPSPGTTPHGLRPPSAANVSANIGDSAAGTPLLAPQASICSPGAAQLAGPVGGDCAGGPVEGREGSDRATAPAPALATRHSAQFPHPPFGPGPSHCSAAGPTPMELAAASVCTPQSASTTASPSAPEDSVGRTRLPQVSQTPMRPGPMWAADPVQPRPQPPAPMSKHIATPQAVRLMGVEPGPTPPSMVAGTWTGCASADGLRAVQVQPSPSSPPKLPPACDTGGGDGTCGNGGHEAGSKGGSVSTQEDKAGCTAGGCWDRSLGRCPCSGCGDTAGCGFAAAGANCRRQRDPSSSHRYHPYVRSRSAADGGCAGLGAAAALVCTASEPMEVCAPFSDSSAAGAVGIGMAATAAVGTAPAFWAAAAQAPASGGFSGEGPMAAPTTAATRLSSTGTGSGNGVYMCTGGGSSGGIGFGAGSAAAAAAPMDAAQEDLYDDNEDDLRLLRAILCSRSSGGGGVCEWDGMVGRGGNGLSCRADGNSDGASNGFWTLDGGNIAHAGGEADLTATGPHGRNAGLGQSLLQGHQQRKEQQQTDPWALQGSSSYGSQPPYEATTAAGTPHPANGMARNGCSYAGGSQGAATPRELISPFALVAGSPSFGCGLQIDQGNKAPAAGGTCDPTAALAAAAAGAGPTGELLQSQCHAPAAGAFAPTVTANAGTGVAAVAGVYMGMDRPYGAQGTPLHRRHRSVPYNPYGSPDAGPALAATSAMAAPEGPSAALVSHMSLERVQPHVPSTVQPAAPPGLEQQGRRGVLSTPTASVSPSSLGCSCPDCWRAAAAATPMPVACGSTYGPQERTSLRVTEPLPSPPYHQHCHAPQPYGCPSPACTGCTAGRPCAAAVPTPYSGAASLRCMLPCCNPAAMLGRVWPPGPTRMHRCTLPCCSPRPRPALGGAPNAAAVPSASAANPWPCSCGQQQHPNSACPQQQPLPQQHPHYPHYCPGTAAVWRPPPHGPHATHPALPGPKGLAASGYAYAPSPLSSPPGVTRAPVGHGPTHGTSAAGAVPTTLHPYPYPSYTYPTPAPHPQTAQRPPFASRGPQCSGWAGSPDTNVTGTEPAGCCATQQAQHGAGGRSSDPPSYRCSTLYSGALMATAKVHQMEQLQQQPLQFGSQHWKGQPWPSGGASNPPGHSARDHHEQQQQQPAPLPPQPVQSYGSLYGHQYGSCHDAGPIPSPTYNARSVAADASGATSTPTRHYVSNSRLPSTAEAAGAALGYGPVTAEVATSEAGTTGASWHSR